MSQAACGGGMTGSGDDNPEDKKGKGMFGKNIPEDSPVLPLTSSSDEESDDQGGDDQPAAKIRGGKRSTLDCLASLEASLPMKRGISSNYCGKSKSYGNLSEVGVVDAKELGKKEHAVNKRRRLLIAHEYPEVVTHGNASASAPAILPLPKDADEDKDGGDGDHPEKKHEEDVK